MQSTKQSATDQAPASFSTNFLQATIADINLPIVICLLGSFFLLKMGHPIRVASGGKAEILLCILALQSNYCASRDRLLSLLWPVTQPTLAVQSLNSLIYSLRKQLGDAIGGAAPILYSDGYYQLNVEAGVGVDVASFDALVNAGEQLAITGDSRAAAETYRNALRLYRGDLCAGIDWHAVLERERLHVRYLNLLAHLAEYAFGENNYAACLDYARRLLDKDPCREDAHRLIMRCYVRQGERAQALRQYRLCQNILHVELDAVPEPATITLYDQMRLDPGSV